MFSGVQREAGGEPPRLPSSSTSRTRPGCCCSTFSGLDRRRRPRAREQQNSGFGCWATLFGLMVLMCNQSSADKTRRRLKARWAPLTQECLMSNTLRAEVFNPSEGTEWPEREAGGVTGRRPEGADWVVSDSQCNKRQRSSGKVPADRNLTFTAIILLYCSRAAAARCTITLKL